MFCYNILEISLAVYVQSFQNGSLFFMRDFTSGHVRFPGGGSDKNRLDNTGDIRGADFMPGSGRSPGGGHSDLLQYSCLENHMDRGVWWATVHKVAKSQTGLKQLSTRAHDIFYSLSKGMFIAVNME